MNEYDAIARIVQHYIDGAKSGRGADMKPAFHQDATIFGYVGPDLFSGPIQQLFDWNDQNGPATGLQARISSIDIIGTMPPCGWNSTTGLGIGLPICSHCLR